MKKYAVVLSAAALALALTACGKSEQPAAPAAEAPAAAAPAAAAPAAAPAASTVAKPAAKPAEPTPPAKH